jgi:hypothetical protein
LILDPALPTEPTRLLTTNDCFAPFSNKHSGRSSITVAKLIGLAPAPLSGITLEDVYFDGGEYKCGNASGTYRNVVPEPCGALSPM